MTFHFATLNSYIRSPTLRVLMTFYLRDFMSVQFWHKVANALRPYDICRSRPYDILILTQGRQRSATFWHFSFATLCQSHSDIKSPTLRDLMTFFVRDFMSVQFWHNVANTPRPYDIFRSRPYVSPILTQGRQNLFGDHMSYTKMSYCPEIFHIFFFATLYPAIVWHAASEGAPAVRRVPI